jgi:hypothetical protein
MITIKLKQRVTIYLSNKQTFYNFIYDINSKIDSIFKHFINFYKTLQKRQIIYNLILKGIKLTNKAMNNFAIIYLKFFKYL